MRLPCQDEDYGFHFLSVRELPGDCLPEHGQIFVESIIKDGGGVLEALGQVSPGELACYAQIWVLPFKGVVLLIVGGQKQAEEGILEVQNCVPSSGGRQGTQQIIWMRDRRVEISYLLIHFPEVLDRSIVISSRLLHGEEWGVPCRLID